MGGEGVQNSKTCSAWDDEFGDAYAGPVFSGGEVPWNPAKPWCQQAPSSVDRLT